MSKPLIAPLLALTTLLLSMPLLAAGTVRLSTPVNGVVKEVFVQPGQRVKHGDKLLALDDTRQRARLMEAEAGLARLKQDAEEADKDLKRAEELYVRGVSATTELDAAKLRHARTTAEFKQADARRIIAQKNLHDTILLAPFDGIIKAREAEPGMVVAVECSPPTLIVLGKLR